MMMSLPRPPPPPPPQRELAAALWLIFPGNHGSMQAMTESLSSRSCAHGCRNGKSGKQR